MPLPCRIFALAFLLLAATAARAATYTDSSRDFSLELPPDWYELTAADVAGVLLDSSPDPNLLGITGFRYNDKLALVLSADDYPAVATYSKVTFLRIREIAASLTKANPAEFQVADRPVVTNLGVGAVRKITCFRQPPGFIVDYQKSQPPARSHSVAFIGQERLITLHFFMHPSDFTAQKPTIDAIATSFRFHPRQAVAFDPATKSPDDHTTLGVYLLVALTLAGAAYLAYHLFKPRPLDI